MPRSVTSGVSAGITSLQQQQNLDNATSTAVQQATAAISTFVVNGFDYLVPAGGLSFVDSNTIAVSVDTNGNITFDLK